MTFCCVFTVSILVVLATLPILVLTKPILMEGHNDKIDTGLSIRVYDCESPDTKSWLLKKEVAECKADNKSTVLQEVNAQVVIKRTVFPVTLRRCHILHRRTKYYW